MSYYVKRSSKQNPAGYAFVGPIRSEKQAERERGAWAAAGETAEVLESSTVKSEVRRWEKATHSADAREIVTYRGEEMTLALYQLAYE